MREIFSFFLHDKSGRKIAIELSVVTLCSGASSNLVYARPSPVSFSLSCILRLSRTTFFIWRCLFPRLHVFQQFQNRFPPDFYAPSCRHLSLISWRKKKKRRETYEYPSQLNFTINENEPMVGNGWILIVDFSPLVLFIISFASCPGMQMAIVFTLGLENPNTRGIPWQTKKRPGSMTLTSHHRRVYIEGVTTWVQHCSFLSLLLSPSLFALFVSRYSCYLCRLEATFLQFNCSLLIFIC